MRIAPLLVLLTGTPAPRPAMTAAARSESITATAAMPSALVATLTPALSAAHVSAAATADASYGSLAAAARTPTSAPAIVQLETLAARLQAASADSAGAPMPPAAPKLRGSRKAAPAVAGVAFAAAVPSEHRALLDDSLRRRKTGWYRGLVQAGVELGGPVPPKLSVTSSDVRGAASAKPRVSFQVEWTQGPMRRGAFQAEIPLKVPEPSIRKQSPSWPPPNREVLIQFKPSADQAAIERIFRDLGLQLLGVQGANGLRAIVPAGLTAEGLARGLSQMKEVLFASPRAADIGLSEQLIVLLENDGPGAVSLKINKLARLGYLVLEQGRTEGWYRLATPKRGQKGSTAAARVNAMAGVLYAIPAEADETVPESLQAVIRFPGYRESRAPAITDAEVKSVLRASGLRVLEDYGGRAFKISVAKNRTGAQLAAAAASLHDKSISVIAVGSLADADVERAVRYTAGHKGSPWSATEYESVKHQKAYELELAGATRDQLKAYYAGVDAAPGGRFNSWSGD